MTGSKVSSPTRRYVAICSNCDDRVYFRSFTLPETHQGQPLENSGVGAIWYFLNVLDSFAFAEGVCTAEQFEDVRPWRRQAA